MAGLLDGESNICYRYVVMKRRTFCKNVILGTAGLCVPGVANGIVRAASEPTLVVGTNTDYRKLVARVLEPLGGMKRFVKPGDKVVIKPNIGWDRNPSQGANTHPDVVAGIAQLALEAGAGSVWVFDRTCNEERLCYMHSFIKPALEALKDSRIYIPHVDMRKFVEVEIPNGESLKKWTFFKEALNADVYINVPAAKHHGLTRLSLGLKNVMGVIGGNRGKIHFAIGKRLAELNAVVKPRLTIIDATRMLLRNGPQGGNLDDVKIADTLIASTDIVAADAYATTLFGLEPDALNTTVAAWKAGLGEMDLNKVTIIRV